MLLPANDLNYPYTVALKPSLFKETLSESAQNSKRLIDKLRAIATNAYKNQKIAQKIMRED